MRIERHRGKDHIDLGGYTHKVNLHSSDTHGGLRGLVYRMKVQLKRLSRDENSGVLHFCYQGYQQGVAFVVKDEGHGIEVIEPNGDWWEQGTAEEAFVKRIDSFETCDFYSIGDGHDTLSHTEWSECVGQHFDDTADPLVHIIQQCDDLAPLEVVGWRKKVLHKSFAEGVIDSMVEELQADCFQAENWWEEYGDPDGENPPIDGVDKKEVAALEADLSEILHAFLLKHAHIWQCDTVASKEFTVDELEEFAKLNYPKEWNEPR